MLISIKLTIPFLSLIIFLPSILTIKPPNNELIELVHEFLGLPKEEVQKLYNNCVYLNDMFAHIDRNPKKLDYEYVSLFKNKIIVKLASIIPAYR